MIKKQKSEDTEEDIYKKKERSRQLDDDEISPTEEGFIEGYNEEKDEEE